MSSTTFGCTRAARPSRPEQPARRAARSPGMSRCSWRRPYWLPQVGRDRSGALRAWPGCCYRPSRGLVDCLCSLPRIWTTANCRPISRGRTRLTAGADERGHQQGPRHLVPHPSYSQQVFPCACAESSSRHSMTMPTAISTRTARAGVGWGPEAGFSATRSVSSRLGW